jgi:tetratricopeptide (TPR) repeat protein
MNDAIKLQQRVEVYLQFERFEAAERTVRTELAMSPQSSHLHNLLGIVLLRQSKFGPALQSLRQAHQLSPVEIEAALNYSILLCDLGLYEEARDVFQSLEKQRTDMQESHWPKELVAQQHLALAVAYRASGQYTASAEELEKALMLVPNFFEALIEQANLMAVKGELAAAKAAAQRCESAHHKSKKLFETLATIAAMESKTDLSIHFLQESRKL